jgi:kynurenine formamidase
MIAHIEWNNKKYSLDFDKPIDISIPLTPNGDNPNCFYAPPFTKSPVEAGDFLGSTQKGGLVNFMNIKLNPHGNGTHTECYGHITTTDDTINSVLKKFMMPAMLLSCYPEMKENGDRVIDLQSLRLLDELNEEDDKTLPEALIIRTLPNDDSKKTRTYSGTNPPYASAEFLIEIRKRGVKHLLIDLPSVDKEQDDGKLAGHKAFWNFDEKIERFNTITELIYVPSLIKDGFYLLQMSIAPFEMDASPSKPILYRLNS